MIFREYNNLYFRSLEKLIALAIRGELDERRLFEVVESTAFSESAFFIDEAIKNGEWSVINRDYTTPYGFVPTLVQTQTELMWLKSVCMDKRIKLFLESEPECLQGVQPLFDPDDIIYPDMFACGDDYEDESYIAIFRTVLRCVKECRKVRIKYRLSSGRTRWKTYIPRRIEYSAKDDKFRLFAGYASSYNILNIGRIEECIEGEYFGMTALPPIKTKKREVVFEIFNKRNCLDRALIHFSSLEKETTRLDKERYLVKMKYTADAETEILIRLMQFGQFVKILEPSDLVEQIKSRIFAQKTVFEDKKTEKQE